MSQKIDKTDGSSNSSSDASAVEKVFGIDELREAILMHAIYNTEGKLPGKLVASLRLVQTSWLQSTSKLLRKVKEPVIELTVDRKCSLKNAKDDKAERKLLDQLLETFGASSRMLDSFLPFKLDFKLDFFRERNYQSLCDILTRFGSNVVELQLEYPKSGGSMPAIFPSFRLPVLQELTFQFSDANLRKNADGFDDNRNGLMLFQLLLDSSNCIKNLIIPFTKSKDVAPVEFKYIRLPATITFLDMRIKLKSKDLEVLLKNQLPSLSDLTLLVHEVPFEDGLLFKILEQFENTLQILKISGIRSNGHPRPPTLLRLPRMEKLKELTIASLECELGPGDASPLQLCLPKIKYVQLSHQTVVRLAKWIQNSTFQNVEELDVSVGNEELSSDHESFDISPSFEILSQLHQSFPNVCKMTLAVNVTDLTSLKHLFQDFVQLKSLSISFMGNDAVLASSSDLIDSIFLGLPLRFVATLKEEKQLLDNGTVAINGGSEFSISNLSELIDLSLCTEEKNDATLGEGMSLMSDLLFRYAFMKMAKLRNLFLYKKFQVRIGGKLPLNMINPTSEMEGEWKRQGRFMEYSAD